MSSSLAPDPQFDRRMQRAYGVFAKYVQNGLGLSPQMVSALQERLLTSRPPS